MKWEDEPKFILLILVALCLILLIATLAKGADYPDYYGAIKDTVSLSEPAKALWSLSMALNPQPLEWNSGRCLRDPLHNRWLLGCVVKNEIGQDFDGMLRLLIWTYESWKENTGQVADLWYAAYIPNDKAATVVAILLVKPFYWDLYICPGFEGVKIVDEKSIQGK